MKKLRLVLIVVVLLVAAVFITGSLVEDRTRASENRCITGTIEINNSRKHPYSIYIDNKPTGTVQGHDTYREYAINTGFHKIYLRQERGYLLAPKEEVIEITLQGCETKTVTF